MSPLLARQVTWIACSLLSFIPQAVAALTIDQAVDRALAVDPQIRVAASRIESAELELRRSRRLLPSNPFFSTTISSSTFEQTSSGEGQPSELPSGTDSYGAAYTFFLEQEIELFGQRSIRIQSADRSLEIAELNREHARAAVAAKVRVGFLSALVKKEFAEIEGESRHWEEEALRGRSPVGGGDDLPDEIAQADAEARVWKARRSQGVAAHELEVATLELRRLLRLSPEEPLSIDGALPRSFPALPPPDALVAMAMEKRADLASQRRMVAWSELQVTLGKRNQIPTISLSAFLSHQDHDQQYGGGIGFPLPIFESPGLEIRSAVIDLDKAKVETAALEDRIAAEVRSAHAACKATADDLRILEREILPRLRRVAAGRDQLFDRGRGSGAAIIDAEMELLDARRDHVAALADHAINLVELERVTGADLSTAPADGAEDQGEAE